MAQLYGCTAANGVWVVPGSHKLGRADIRAMAARAGCDRFPEAVPIICKPGDVAITNRQAVHGSFANTSRDWRVTVNMGFHRRRSVLGVNSAGSLHGKRGIYDEARITERSKVIGYAIDARKHRFPDESPFVYQPHQASGPASWSFLYCKMARRLPMVAIWPLSRYLKGTVLPPSMRRMMFLAA
jgi:ectoine hydroxylase-related dioxygenase (phytanoyl-CoA dioxygenase family)